MSLKTNSGYASAVEECKRLQRELALAGQNYEALTKESLDTQERLQRELEEARAIPDAMDSLQRDLADLLGEQSRIAESHTAEIAELVKDLKFARQMFQAASLGKSTAEKRLSQVCEDRDMARSGLIETGRIIGCTLADDVSTAFISLGIPAEAKLALASLRERVERAELRLERRTFDLLKATSELFTLTKERDAALARGEYDLYIL